MSETGEISPPWRWKWSWNGPSDIRNTGVNGPHQNRGRLRDQMGKRGSQLLMPFAEDRVASPAHLRWRNSWLNTRNFKTLVHIHKGLTNLLTVVLSLDMDSKTHEG